MVGAIFREFLYSPRRSFNARNLPTRSARMLTLLITGYSRKKQGRWGYGNSRGIEEKACGNSRKSTKKEVEVPGDMKKNHVEFSLDLSWFSTLEFPRGVIQVCMQNFQGWKLVLSKVTNRKIPGVFSKRYILNLPRPPPCLVFFWNNPTFLRDLL